MPAMTGAGGAIPATAATVRAVKMGDATVRDLDVAVSDVLGFLSSAAGHPLDGIIGYSFLRRFRVTIDYPRARLTLAHGR